jgi:hypothetical protein
MLLKDISANDPVTALALRGLLETCPILNEAQFVLKSGPAASIKRAREGATATLITRAINTSNTATPPTPAYDTATKKIVSFDSKVDVIIEDRNEDPETELATQTYLDARENGFPLQALILVGDSGSVATDFDGMAELVDATKILAADMSLVVGGDSVRGVQAEAIEKLLQHVTAVTFGASDMYMNEFLKTRLALVGKNLGLYNTIQEFGVTVERIGPVRIHGAGYDKSGDPLLPFTESGNTSSIYMVRWGEGVDLTCITSAGVKGRYAGQIGNFLLNNINLDMVMHLQNKAALVKSTGWKLSE